MGMFRLMSVYKATSGQGNVLPDIFYKAISSQGIALPDVCLQTKQFLVKAMFHLFVYKQFSICTQTEGELGCNQLFQLVTTGEHAGRQLLLGVRY